MKDPIAELTAEIEAEAAAETKTDEKTEEVVEAKVEEKPEDQPEAKAEEGTDEEAAAEVEGRPAKKAKDDRVPRARIDEEVAKRRIAERQVAERDARIAALENPPKPGEAKQPTIEEIRAEAREAAKMELRIEDFLATGAKDYGVTEFDEACDRLAKLGGTGDLVQLALEATDRPKDAAKAIFVFAGEEAEEIERVLKLPVLRRTAYLARLADKRISRQEPEELEVKPGKKVSAAAKPIQPINGNAIIPEGFGDEVPDDVFTERFDKMLEKSAGRAH